MAKNSIRDYSATNSSNTDIQSIDISEGCSPAGINNAIREVMADLKDVSTGAVALESPAFDSVTGNLNVNGTVTADGLTVNDTIRLDNEDTTVSAGDVLGDIEFYDNDGGATGAGVTSKIEAKALSTYGASNLNFYTSGSSGGARTALTQRMQIDGNGDISFYEDTGTTAKFFWDASAESLGIGTINPSARLHVAGGSARFVSGGSGGIFGDDNASYFLVQASPTANAAAIYFNGQARSGFESQLHYGASNHVFYNESLSAERMRIDSSGNVGIGVVPTTDHNPVVEALQIGSTANLYGRNDAETTTLTSNSYLSLAGYPKYITTNEASEYIQSSGNHVWYNAPSGTAGAACTQTERMRIDSSGNLLVGKTAGSNTTKGFNAVPSGEIVSVITTAGGSQQNIFLNRQDADGTAILFRRANGTVGSISVNSSSTAYNTSSDYRLKENVTATWDATTRLKQLNPVRFNFIADADTTVDGFLAHEVQDVVPEAISGTKDAMRDEEYEVSAATGDIYTPAIEAVLDEDGNEVTPAVAEVIHSTDVERPEELAEGQQWRETTAAVMGTRSVPDYQGIDQSKLTPLLTKALIEAVEKIEQLETRIAALENV